MSGGVETKYSEVNIGDVIDHYVKGYRPDKGKRLSGSEHYYDPHKGKVIIKLYVVDDEKP